MKVAFSLSPRFVAAVHSILVDTLSFQLQREVWVYVVSIVHDFCSESGLISGTFS